MKQAVPGDKGRPGDSHHGEEGGRGSSAAAVRAKVWSADLGAAAAVVPEHGERERERGTAGAREGEARLLFNRAEERGKRSHDARRGRRLLQRRARAVPSCAGKRTALTGGAERLASAGKGAVAVAARPLGWAGPAAVLGRARREAGLLALGRARQGGELGRGKAGLRGKERRPAGRNSRREGKNDSFLFFFYYFPNPFLNSNFNSF